MERRGVWDDAIDAAAAAEAATLRTALRDAVFDAPDGDVLELFDHVFKETTPGLVEQRRDLDREMGRST
jgi:pyruvate dehydrogenase E1 component alpha subunit